MGDRTGKQCRERYHNHLNSNIRKGSWSKEEDDLINELQESIGNQWSKIAKLLPGRSDNAIKNRWHVIHRVRQTDEEIVSELSAKLQKNKDLKKSKSASSTNKMSVKTEVPNYPVDLMLMYHCHDSHYHEYEDIPAENRQLQVIDRCESFDDCILTLLEEVAEVQAANADRLVLITDSLLENSLHYDGPPTSTWLENSQSPNSINDDSIEESMRKLTSDDGELQSPLSSMDELNLALDTFSDDELNEETAPVFSPCKSFLKSNSVPVVFATTEKKKYTKNKNRKNFLTMMETSPRKPCSPLLPMAKRRRG